MTATSGHVSLDGDTFAILVGREDPDVYLFRVSEAWLDAMGDNEWHGPVEWRIVRREGSFVDLEMRAVKPVDYAFTDALLALSELGHDDAVERLRRRWSDVVTT